MIPERERVEDGYTLFSLIQPPQKLGLKTTYGHLTIQAHVGSKLPDGTGGVSGAGDEVVPRPSPCLVQGHAGHDVCKVINT